MNVNITDIKRFAVHDGDGIRTTVFFKGCPLKCVWCHNPETIQSKPSLAFYAHKCTHCGSCAAVCQCHKIENGIHTVDRERCTLCGICAEKCQQEALILCGREISCEEVCRVLLEDKEFYAVSGGGITLSGGECLMQPEACLEILKVMKEEKIHTAVDTCGMVKWANIQSVLDYTDVFLYDLKAIDDAVHRRCTGASNRLILENLKRIDGMGKQTEIRIPCVPGYNDGEMDKLANYVSSLENVVKVRILAYHDYARSKYRALDWPDTMPKNIPAEEQLTAARKAFLDRGILCV